MPSFIFIWISLIKSMGILGTGSSECLETGERLSPLSGANWTCPVLYIFFNYLTEIDENTTETTNKKGQ